MGSNERPVIQDNVERLTLPWQLIIAPRSGWITARQFPALWPPLVVQWLLLATALAISYKPLSALLGSGFVIRGPAAFISAIALCLLLVLLGNFGMAGLSWSCLALVNIRIAYRHCVGWLAYSAVPCATGHLLGVLLFCFTRPGTQTPQQALSYLIKPYSLGLATFFPEAFPALSFHWLLATVFDVFGLWSLVILAYGTQYYLGFDRARGAWAIAVLVLLSLFNLTMLWHWAQ